LAGALRGDGGGDGGTTQVPNVEFSYNSEVTTSACSCKTHNNIILMKAAKKKIIQKEVVRNATDRSSA
jgi:hypothetical protein